MPCSLAHCHFRSRSAVCVLFPVGSPLLGSFLPIKTLGDTKILVPTKRPQYASQLAQTHALSGAGSRPLAQEVVDVHLLCLTLRPSHPLARCVDAHDLHVGRLHAQLLGCGLRKNTWTATSETLSDS